MNHDNIREVQYKQFIKINWDAQAVCASEQMDPGNIQMAFWGNHKPFWVTKSSPTIPETIPGNPSHNEIQFCR